MIRSLLPTGRAWSLPFLSTIGKWIDAVDLSLYRARDAIAAQLWGEYESDTTTLLNEWEKELGIFPRGDLSDSDRRSRIAARRAEARGLGLDVIESKLRDAGFDVHVFPPWWNDGGRWELRNPATHFSPLYGGTALTGHLIRPGHQSLARSFLVVQCGEFQAGEVQCGDGSVVGVAEAAQYIPGKDDHSNFVYVAGEGVSTAANIPASRRQEFEQLVLQHIGAHTWAALNVQFQA